MKTLQETLVEYKSLHRALPAFNIDSFEIFQAIENAVRDTSLPCIVQLSDGEDKYFSAEKLFLLVKKANLDGLPIYLNMDHCQNLDRMKQLARLGFDMLHFDGSKLSFDENLSLATSLISEVRSFCPDIVFEVEFNHINLIERGVGPGSFTDPDQAKDFMTRTNADLLAVSIGNLHGVSTTAPETIDLPLLQKIIDLLPDKMYTLHGGSGIAWEQVKSAIGMGIVKININTDLRLQYKRSLVTALTEINSEKIYNYLNPVVADVSAVVKQKLIQFWGQ